jgi:hypothetical protein
MMPNCTVCKSVDRKKIERLLILGTSYASVTRQFGMAYKTLKNHKVNHLPEEVARSMVKTMPEMRAPIIKVDKRIPQLKDLMGCVSYIHNRLIGIQLEAQEDGNRQLELQAFKLDLETIGVVKSGHEMLLAYEAQGSWDKVLPDILEAVRDFPAARKAIFNALRNPVIEGKKMIKIN